jgi:hypothetical protein
LSEKPRGREETVLVKLCEAASCYTSINLNPQTTLKAFRTERKFRPGLKAADFFALHNIPEE